MIHQTSERHLLYDKTILGLNFINATDSLSSKKRAWDEMFSSHFPCGNPQIVGQIPPLKINQLNTILNVWVEVNLHCLATEMLPIWHPDMLKFSHCSYKVFLL